LVSVSKISSWLNHPHSIQPADSKTLKELAEQYPYCSPFRYLPFLQQPVPEEAAFLRLRQLLPASPVLLHALLHPDFSMDNRENVEKEIPASQIEYPAAGSIDYFSSQGIEVPSDLPETEAEGYAGNKEEAPLADAGEQSLMVVMSFSEWLAYLQSRTQKAREEEEGKKALRALWQKQKLAEALEEEDEEIPENVFTMAVNSITPEDELISESLAEVYRKQGKKNKAIELYQKLSLRNPEKKIYFAHKIEHLKKVLEI
jgi:hypothetical protein